MRCYSTDYETASTLVVKRIIESGDSKLIVDQVMKASACRDHKMDVYCAEVKKLEAKFDGMELRHIPRRHNEEANNLPRIGSTWDIPPVAYSLMNSPNPWHDGKQKLSCSRNQVLLLS